MAFNYSPKIITDGLVLYLDAANTKSYPTTGTTWSDISRGGNIGTLTNGPTFNSGNSGSFSFDGTNDYVGISASGFNLGVNFTLQVWTRITRFGGGPFTGAQNRASLITNSYPYSTNQGFLFMATSQAGPPNFSPTPGRETFFLSIGNDQFGVSAAIGSLTAFVNNWVQLSVTVNSTNPMRLYINGVEASYGSQGNGPSSLSYTAGPFSLGVFNNVSEFLQGSIAQTLVYNRALTASEILQNYNTTRTRFGL